MLILSYYNKIRKLWNKYGFELLLLGTLIFILGYWFFYTRNNEKGTYSREFEYKPTTTLSRKRPPKVSKGETECRRVLEKLFQKPFPNQRPTYIVNSVTGQNLEIDCYNENLKLGCEYQGRQHYHYIPFMHRSRDAFRNQQYRDQMKLQTCRKIGINLIVVPYTVPVPKIETYIKTELRKFGYNFNL